MHQAANACSSTKIKSTKINSGDLAGQVTNICTAENFLLYGMCRDVHIYMYVHTILITCNLVDMVVCTCRSIKLIRFST